MKIKVYTYCSYKFSPVGFQHGVFQLDTKSSNEKYIVPSTNSDISPIVRNCFVEGLVQKAMGKIPEKNEYIVLIKGLECDYINEDGMPAKKYGNFAFSTDDPKVYNNLTALNKSKLSEAMNSFLIPDSNAGDTAIKIDTKEFIDFIKGVSKKPNTNEDLNDFNIISSYSGDKVISTLEERFPEYDVDKISDNSYKLKKNSKAPTILRYIKEHPIIPIIVALIAIITVILVILLRK